MKKPTTILAITLICAAAMNIAACGNGPDEVTPTDPVLDVTPRTLTFASSDAEPQTLAVTSSGVWETEPNADWIAVSPSSGAANGSVTVTVEAANEARSGSVTVTSGSLSVTITVNQSAPDVVPATGIELDKSTLEMEIGDEIKLTATVAPANVTNAGVIWSSSDDLIVTVDDSGLVKAIAEGPAVITAKTEDGSNHKATCNITVKPAERVIHSGETGALTWTLTDLGTLAIGGEGVMPNYTDNGAPWNDYLDDIKRVVVHEGVTGIGEYAFSRCKFLAEATLPNSLTEIGANAFSYSEFIKKIAIPDGVKAIKDFTFFDCYELTEVTLPEGLTSIGYMAFYDCWTLAAITIPDSVTSIGNSCFGGCSSLTEIVIPEGITNIGHNTFNTCSSLSKITIPDTVISIGTAAFYYCAFTEIALPSALKTMGDEIFMGCNALTEVTIPDTVTSVGMMAFNGCNALTKITALPTAPPTLGFNPVSDYSAISLYVPAGSVTEYRNANNWGNFTTITAIP